MMQILIVDDEEYILRLVSYNLKTEGYEVIMANNGMKGIEQAIQNLPDLILLDFMLPDMTGLDLCKKLRSNPRTKDIIIVFMSAKGQTKDFAQAQLAGADDYITKPFIPDDLIDQVKMNIEKIGKKRNE
jgi:DNA-binding response OmpR family regulator